MTTQPDLIERLEKATGPDDYLDCCIREAVEGWKNVGGGYREWPDGRRERYDYGCAEPYTASIDAALTLVPDGTSFTLTRSDQGRCWAEVGEEWQYDGATPALALCIAALKARMGDA